MYQDKFSQQTLKELLIYSSKAIAEVNNKGIMSDLVHIKLINIFSDLLREKYDKSSFLRDIVKKNLPSKPSAKKVVKEIYTLIVSENLDDKKLSDMSKNILNTVDRLNRFSRLFHIKTHLKNKILQIVRIKKIYLSNDSKIRADSNINALELSIQKFITDPNFNFKDTLKILSELNDNIELVTLWSSTIKVIELFFSKLSIKCKEFIREEAYTYDSEKIMKQVKDIISELNILATGLASIVDNRNIDESLKLLREIVYLSKSDKAKFEWKEQKRLDKAYSIKSMKQTLKTYQSAIDYADFMLKENGVKLQVKKDSLSKFWEMVNGNDVKLLDKKIYDKTLDEIKKTTQKTISNVKIKKICTHKEVLDCILKIFG